jgi:hypothetical protein
MGNRVNRIAVGLGLTVALLLAGCGSDDGAGVRTVGDGGQTATGPGSASGPGSATASGPGSATASGTASGSQAVACKPVGDASKADSTIAVNLSEWSVLLARADAPAGTIAFEAHNLGAEPHELVVVRADDPAALPKAADGTVDEQQLPAGALIGEIEAFPAKQTCAGTFPLTPGRYALFCNLLETAADGTRQNHYTYGMRTGFQVRA